MPLSLCYYILSSADRFLLVNVIGLSMLLSGASSLGYLVPSLAGSRPALGDTPNASGTGVSSLHKISCMCLLLKYISPYLIVYDNLQFHVHSALTDVNCLSDLHISALLGYDLLR